MNDFVINGNKYFLKPEGKVVSLENGMVYYLKYDRFEDDVYLDADGKLDLPEKIYEGLDEDRFVNQVMTHFNSTTETNTGVLLTGLKGSGKTLMSKRLAIETNLPIIIVDKGCPVRATITFFVRMTQPCVVIFDEIEKNSRYWNSDDLLSLLDGVQGTCKKLVILTCNQDSELSDNIKDRCSRIRYYKVFKGISDNTIESIVRDKIHDKDAIDVVNYFIKQFTVKSYDNIVAFIDEINHYKSDEINLQFVTTLTKNMNIQFKSFNSNTDDERYNTNRETTSVKKGAEKTFDSIVSEEVVDCCGICVA